MTTKSKQNASTGGDYFSHVRNNAKKGEAWAQKALGDIYYFSVEDQETEKSDESKREQFKYAAQWYAKAAKQGDAEGQHALGGLYYFGEGVDQNLAHAAELYKEAAEKGFAKAQFDFGRLCYLGKGVAENKAHAAEWYEKAGKNMYKYYKDAWYPLGLMHLKGDGIDKNFENALIYFMLAYYKNDMEAAKSKIAEINWRGELSASKRQYAHELLFQIFGGYNYYPEPEKIGERISVALSSTNMLTPEEIYERVWRSVVVVEDGRGGQSSGVIVQPNIVATNFHVVEKAISANTGHRFLVRKPVSKFGIKAYPYFAELRAGPKDSDLCLLDVDGLWGYPAAIRNFQPLNFGERVYALGAPKGQVLSLTAGIISQFRTGGIIQTDASISPGSSGGGLFDSGGNLIGITTGGIVDEGVEGIQFAISAQKILDY